jgi:5'-nucleotidase
MRIVIALLAALGAISVSAAEPVRVKIAAINDFHGNLRTPGEGLTMPDGTAVPAGGIAHIAARVAELRAASPHFTFVSAGDMVGASPLLSTMFDDEPSVEAMSLAGMELAGAGNHELDHGMQQLLRLQRGGCPKEGCKSGLAFPGARFQFLAANVIEKATGKPLLPPYGVKQFGPVKVAFIGVTTRDTGNLIPARHAAPLEFRDEAQSANALVPELRAQGIEAIVLLVHEGGQAGGGANACVGPRGPILDIVARLDPAIDIVVSAHTHRSYVCRLSGRLVTSAGSYGRLLTEIDVEIDPQTRDVVRAEAVNRVVRADVQPHAAVAALVERYAKIGAATLDRPVGRIAASFSRAFTPDGEHTMGRLVADSQLAATASRGARIAFMNPGGIRASLLHRGDGSLLFADIYEVYPFDNALVTMTLSGAQLVQLLEQQWQAGQIQMLQVSRGFSYQWDPALPEGRRIVRAGLDGEALRPDASYRVTVNNYLAGGGDGFKVLTEGRDRVSGLAARDELIRYLETGAPKAPDRERRIEAVRR